MPWRSTWYMIEVETELGRPVAVAGKFLEHDKKGKGREGQD